jgi:putative flippase GtrA
MPPGREMPPGEADGPGGRTGARPERRRGLAVVAEWVRHHAASVVTTLVDFLVMIAAVEGFGAGAVVGTAIGAAVGAVTNFLLGRFWTYRARRSPVGSQVLRYALVAAGSLGLNALGEYVLVAQLGAQYVFGRVITALIVSNVWNYPMQRFFVFGTEHVEQQQR